MMIKLENVSKNWKDFKIQNINLEIWEKEYFVLLGPTGAGKTLLLELIAGFHIPKEGDILINGINVKFLPSEKRNIGFVYQNYMLFPHKNVFENISYGLKLRKFDKFEIEKKVKEIAEILKIEHLLGRDVRKLSGGEQQRVALARALIIKPRLLLLDEPLSSLDPITQKEIRKELKRIHREMEITTIHVTHNQQEALFLADRIGVINKGRILQVGTPEEIFRKPTSEFMANFVGVENLLKGNAKIKNDLTIINVDGINLVSTNKIEGNVHLTIRPEDIIISREKIKSSARNSLKGNVIEIADMGGIIRVCVDVGFPLVVFVTRQSFIDLEINIGSAIWLSFKAQSVHVF